MIFPMKVGGAGVGESVRVGDDADVGVCVRVGMFDGAGAMVGVEVIVGPGNCPGLQLDISILMKTIPATNTHFMFILHASFIVY